MHAVRMQCACSAKFWMFANTRTLLLAPFDKFLVPHWGFFWLPMHLGCGTFELSPFVAHFQPFLPIFHPPVEKTWGNKTYCRHPPWTPLGFKRHCHTFMVWPSPEGWKTRSDKIQKVLGGVDTVNSPQLLRIQGCPTFGNPDVKPLDFCSSCSIPQPLKEDASWTSGHTSTKLASLKACLSISLACNAKLTGGGGGVRGKVVHGSESCGSNTYCCSHQAALLQGAMIPGMSSIILTSC